MTWNRLVGFGEGMIRLTSPVGIPLPAATALDVSVGGAELNVLVAGRLSGMPAKWVTALPDNPLGDLVTRHVGASGVDLHLVGSRDERMGIYFLDSHAPPRPSQVTYDRRGSAFSSVVAADVDWAAILTADTCLVLSGITPALGPGPREAMLAAVDAAKAVGATVAYDVNFRPSLWDEADCFALLHELLPSITVLAASPHDLRAAGIDADQPHSAAVAAYDLTAAIGTVKTHHGPEVAIEVIAAGGDGEVREQVRTTVVDAVGAGDALFGTFLAAMPSVGLEAAARQALAAAVTVYGTAGDLMVSEPWNIDGKIGGVLR